MRIAQVAPLQEAVLPRFYGGTERVVSYLTESLVQLGHDVTLFASGDSETRARLVPICPQALRLDPDCQNSVPYEILALEAAIGEADEFDVIHFHEACLHLPWTRRVRCATVTTMHGRLDLRDFVPLYREYADVPLVSISDAQREPMPWANWRATVYHGLPDDLYRLHPEPGGYLAFLGRICPEKRVDRAIAIAQRVGIELKIAAKVDAADKEYFETEIRHLLDDPLVDFIGEIGDGEKEAFLGGAAALLMPIGWPEPFGLVVIEAMACGTPVIAFPFGSMPELIEPGVNGALVESVDQAVAAVEALAALDRTLCRRSFEERFTMARMARDYVGVYEPLVEQAVSSRAARRCPRQGSRSQFLRWSRPRSGSQPPGSTKPASTGHDRDEGGGAPVRGRPLNEFFSAVPPQLGGPNARFTEERAVGAASAAGRMTAAGCKAARVPGRANPRVWSGAGAHGNVRVWQTRPVALSSRRSTWRCNASPGARPRPLRDR